MNPIHHGWHWKQCSYNAFVLRGPLGTAKWFETYEAVKYDDVKITVGV